LVPQVQSEPLPIKAVEPAPCTQACPAGINVKAYVSLIAEGRFEESLAVVRERCPLPAICGRICHHPCESVCERRAVDEPVAIRLLKRFVADLGTEVGPRIMASSPRRDEKVAIIGSGPAGLTAAWDLARIGYPVTVFEANDEPGGMLRYGITEYRLPRPVIEHEIDTISRAGVEIRTGYRIGVDLELEHLIEQGYLATLFAVGAQKGRNLEIEGESDCDDVVDALTFLRRVNEGDRRPVQGRVAVIGGGSTAVEAARSALRLGANSVDVLYRRYREELLADAEEITAAESEGIAFRFLVTPTRVLASGGRLKGLECVRVGLGEPDTSGRRRPITIPGSEFTVDANLVLVAVGQRADLDFVPGPFQPRMIEGGLIRTETATAMTPWQGVFAAGDAVSGPATVIDAIAEGHQAASSIHHFLESGRPGIADLHPERRAAPELELPDMAPLEALRAQPIHQRVRPGREFLEVEGSLPEVEAVAEARRCLRCGPCGDCRVCVPTCRRRHVMLRSQSSRESGEVSTAILRTSSSVALNLSTIQPTVGRLLPDSIPRLLPEIGADEGTSVELLPVRATVQGDLCRACGRCVDVCPFGAVEAGSGATAIDVARIEPALCRGCNLCVGVCPTGAAQPTALSPVWWGSRLDDAFREDDPCIVLACQRRAGALENALFRRGSHIEVIRFRCVGQIDAGMLLDLERLGAKAVLVAGCSVERCRFDTGARLALEQTQRARAMIELLGVRPVTLLSDWSDSRETDPLDEPILQMLNKLIASGPIRPQPVTH
jgi:NADPH-dependent glutamate synthase beta subunit-like oxidoreductase/coenzyme F420-reducing hydrogenase delta subunit/Pyruvate/2-oxoacid:ferredoxin oxidoreductase delta subunit